MDILRIIAGLFAFTSLRIVPDEPPSAGGGGDGPKPSTEEQGTPAPGVQSTPDAGLVEPLPEPGAPGGGDSGGLADDHAKDYAGFNPEIHAVNDDGTPKLTPTGRFAKKPKAAQSSANAGFASRKPNAAKPGNVGAVPVDNWPVAKQVVNVFISGMARFVGPEWEPVDRSEAESLGFAVKDYFDARGVPQLPPEAMLLLAVAAYSLPRLNHENTATKLQRLMGRAKDWVSNLRKKGK